MVYKLNAVLDMQDDSKTAVEQHLKDEANKPPKKDIK